MLIIAVVTLLLSGTELCRFAGSVQMCCCYTEVTCVVVNSMDREEAGNLIGLLTITAPSSASLHLPFPLIFGHTLLSSLSFVPYRRINKEEQLPKQGI